MLLQAVGAAADPSSGGRQMPSHWGDPAKNIVSSSSATGTQFVQAVGCAEGCRFLLSRRGPHRARQFRRRRHQRRRILGIHQPGLPRAPAPVLFLIEDNGYAISVPVESQTPGGSISKLLAGFPGSAHASKCDGTDFIASYRAMSAAAA